MTIKHIYNLSAGLAFILAFVTAVPTFGQLADTEAEFDSLYAIRIQKDVLNGVYIPADLEDSFRELQRLSAKDDIEKFKNAPEEVVRDRLHFGLGRWISVNWGFYLGSRFSHYLRELGLEHPDDMTKVVLVSFHRHLNEEPLRVEEQVDFYHELREKERQQRAMNQEVILDTVRIRKQ